MIIRNFRARAFSSESNRGRRVARGSILAATTAAFVSVATSQPRTATPLAKLADVASEFSNISAIRELSDGRVLVADSRVRELVLVDPRTHTRVAIGRRGEGPGEYGNPLKLWSVGEDSTVLLSSGSRLQLLFRSRFVPFADVFRQRAGKLGGNVEGMDKRGNVLRVVGIDRLKVGETFRLTQSISFSAVVAIIRVSASGILDTIAKVRGAYEGPGKRHVRQSGASVGIETFELASGLPTAEQAVLFPDGGIALALHHPYRVDWIGTDGVRIEGKPIAEVPAPVTAKMKKEIARENRMSDATPEDFAFWPETVPPFVLQALLAGVDGRLYIRRTATGVTEPGAFDVVDRTGKRATFTLPPRSRIVGTGKRGLYVATRDEDDVESLALFKAPP